MTSHRRALRVFSLGFFLLAGVLALIAQRHMSALAAYGEICGGAVRHCAACPAAIAAAALGLAVLAASAHPALRPARD